MIKINETTYSPWGKCLQLTNGKIELLITTEVGPRIIRASFIGGENFMCEDTENQVCQSLGTSFSDNVSDGMWYLMGGHRLWASPEALPRTYTPENEPYTYELTKNGVVLHGKKRALTGLSYSITVTMDEDNKVYLHHTMTNEGVWPAAFAPWALTVLCQGGKEVIPLPETDTGLLHNTTLTLWPYAKMNDKRVYWGERYITLQQDPNANCNFKLGLRSEHGWAAYFVHGGVFLKRFTPIPGGVYPDDGSNFESYTSPVMLEMETLGQLKLTQPGETVCHDETWQLFDGVAAPSNDEEEIAAVMANLL